MNITYLTEDPGKDYAKKIRGAKTLADLRAVLQPFKLIAADATSAAAAMDEAAFVKWRLGLPNTVHNLFPGEEWMDAFGMILLPVVMLEVSLTAIHFGAPWGTAYIQLCKHGRIVEVDGVASVVPVKP